MGLFRRKRLVGRETQGELDRGALFPFEKKIAHCWEDLRCGDIDAAMSHASDLYDEAMRIHAPASLRPWVAELLVQVGEIAHFTGSPLGAQACFKRSLELAPNERARHYLSGSVVRPSSAMPGIVICAKCRGEVNLGMIDLRYQCKKCGSEV